jgi:Protein of unknown function (DUF2608)
MSFLSSRTMQNLNNIKSCLAACLTATLTVGCAFGQTNPSTVVERTPRVALRAAAPVETISTMQPAVDRALDYARQHGAARVLVIFDIDSTLLYDPTGGPDLDSLEETEPARFRQVERAVMNLKSLSPTEPGLVAELARLEAAGVATFAMTARGEDMRDMTHRELDAHRIVFPLAPECGPPLCTRRGRLGPDHVLSVARSVLGQAELDRVGFARGRTISVSDGVMMATGLDKGVLTRILMASLGGDYRAVVFVDDAQKNVDNVSRISAGMREDVSVFHYRAPLTPPDRPHTERDALWREAEDAICIALRPRWCPARD